MEERRRRPEVRSTQLAKQKAIVGWLRDGDPGIHMNLLCAVVSSPKLVVGLL